MHRWLIVAALLLTAGLACIAQAQPVQTLLGVGAPKASSGLLLDNLSATALGAFSSRKLRTAYAGNALQAQQINGGVNPTQNIGFVSNNLDETSLATFIGSNTAGISIWYDQASTNNGVPDSTPGNDPIIVTTGTNNRENGHVCPNYNGGTLKIQWAGSLTQPQPITIAVMFHLAAINVGGMHDGTGGQRIAVGTFMSAYIMYAGSNILSGGTADTNAHGFITVFNGTSSKGILDGSTIISGSTTPGSGAFDATLHNIGANAGGTAMNGNLCELLAFIGDIGPTDEATIRSSWQTYWGTP